MSQIKHIIINVLQFNVASEDEVQNRQNYLIQPSISFHKIWQLLEIFLMLMFSVS